MTDKMTDLERRLESRRTMLGLFGGNEKMTDGFMACDDALRRLPAGERAVILTVLMRSLCRSAPPQVADLMILAASMPEKPGLDDAGLKSFLALLEIAGIPFVDASEMIH